MIVCAAPLPQENNMQQSLIEKFIAFVGTKNAITDKETQVPYLREWRDMWRGETPVVLRPASAAEVSAIMKLAHETNTKIVPQSGNYLRTQSIDRVGDQPHLQQLASFAKCSRLQPSWNYPPHSLQ